MNEEDTSLYGKNRKGKVALCETCAYDGYCRDKIHVLVKERRGNHLKGEVYGEGEVKFNVEQIIQVYESK